MTKEPKVVLLDLYENINDATTDNYRFFTEPIEYTFPETFFSLFIDDLQDSALVRVTHSWVAPDSLKIPVSGLTLSPYRHWKIEGIIPDEMQARGKFFYTTSSNLDNNLITSANDSIVILYRRNPGEEWSSVSQTRIGVWSVGNIIVDNIKPGEYTLAVWDTQIVSQPEQKNENGIKIYPNPSYGKLNFEFSESGSYTIKIFSEDGKEIDMFNINSRKGKRKLNRNDTTGVVMVQVYEDGVSIATKKIVLVR